MGSPEKQRPHRQEELPIEKGELVWTARAKETAGSVFLSGRYSAATQAILEFTDNSFGYRNRDRVYPTRVTITIDKDKDRVNVLDFGGLGTDANGIKRFLRVGETEDMGIGYRGAGAKFASWFLGMDVKLSAKRQGEDIVYVSEIEGFGDPSKEYAGNVDIKPTKTTFDLDKGRFEIEVSKLKVANLPHGSSLKRDLSEVYRPLLTKEGIMDLKNVRPLERRIVVDNEGNKREVNDKVVLFVTTSRRKEQVFPLEIPLLPEYSEEDVKITETGKGEKLWFWYGEMDSTIKKVQPGMRFYYDGRLINVDFCGFNEKDPRLAGLTGEVHLDNVMGIKGELSVNKSAGINNESDQWQRVIKVMNQVLMPFVDKLLKKPIPLAEKRPRYIDQALAEARRLMDLAVDDMMKEGKFFTHEEGVFIKGETVGQKSPQKRNDILPPKVGGGGSHPGKKWEEQKGQTPPAQDADPSILRIRKSIIDRYDLAELPDAALQSMLIEEEGEGRKYKTLLLNTRNPSVQVAMADETGIAFEMLYAEQLADYIAQIYSTDREKYIECRKDAIFKFACLIQSTPAYKMLHKKRFH